MSLFPSANDFKSGPGVEKDAPRKTGVGRFFELVGRDMSGMFLANAQKPAGLIKSVFIIRKPAQWRFLPKPCCAM